jgi:hypothetical protein
LQKLLIQYTVANQNFGSATPATQTSEAHNVQSTNPKGNQQPEGKRKAKGKKGKGGKKAANNVGKGRSENNKVKFSCKLCTDDHLNHQFPQLEESQNILAE